jgi:hypothetical protein
MRDSNLSEDFANSNICIRYTGIFDFGTPRIGMARQENSQTIANVFINYTIHRVPLLGYRYLPNQYLPLENENKHSLKETPSFITDVNFYFQVPTQMAN